ncbi:class 3 adenylate cyclase [Ensifer adhaerens]|uniref:Class 3 adenylate cyclase n=1 Tax=Ensifer adhaerens TaxID=106592 RepID=A0ACC5SQX7_ENSAD|nr:adenylate/guanylate cyclase domain-containing protein [Ensifer adhaerens]MBP1871262.1 class 3 adenylate cyclase [Ensifer adhaerens]
MAETRRKLTTIFSADVQDYSRLMRADEEGTLATLKRYRDAMTRLIEAHGGRVINTWGDGLIADFPSVVEALRAAIDVQSELAGYNAKSADSAPMLFRIGINLGDVITEDDDIYGDGVNVAARLQASAPAGGIVISNTVYDQVRNKVAVGFEFLGQLEVKNIDGGVPSYAVRIGAADDAAAGSDPGGEWGRPVERPVQPALVPVETTARPMSLTGKLLGALAVIGAGLVALNLLSWRGVFWATWPLLGLAVVAALEWVRANNRIDRVIGTLAIVGLTLVAINVLSWRGVFWAVWPLLAIAVAAGIRWVMRGRDGAKF